MEYSRRRILAKTFVWRMIATLTGAAIAAFLNPSEAVETAGWFIVIEFPLKMMFYYMHERGWEMITWGATPKPRSGSHS